MKPYLNTEYEVWMYMADMWTNNVIMDFSGFACISNKMDGINSGLCTTVEDMSIFGLIDIEMYRLMEKRLRENLPNIEGRFEYDYCWPRTPIGAQSRAEFCLKMANKCTKKEV